MRLGKTIGGMRHKFTGWAIPLLLVSLTVLALACAPTSPPKQGAATQAETIMPAETPTETIQPTKTPYPTDYVKPTDLPTWTPFPTLAPDPTLTPTPEGVVPLWDHSGGSAPAPTPTLSEQVTQFAREKEWKYDAIARVKALSHRNVTVPSDIEWPPYESPIYGSHTFIRTSMRVIETYRGVLLPDNYEIVSFSTWENTKLDIDRNYILFVRKQYVAKEEYPDDVTRHRFNEEQLDAFGGTGGILLGVQVWIVDENTAWRVPIEHFQDTVPGSNWEAAKAEGESLPVAELEAAIAAAFK